MSEWINIYNKKPVYGVPVILKVNGTVQHVTYCLDGVDYDHDWLEPYGNNADEITLPINGDIQWQLLPE